MNAPAQTTDDRSIFADEELIQRLLAIDLTRLDVDQARDQAADALVRPLAGAMLFGAVLAGLLLKALGLDVTRLYAGAAYAPVRVLLHNTLGMFFLLFPLVLLALKSRRGAALRLDFSRIVRAALRPMPVPIYSRWKGRRDCCGGLKSSSAKYSLRALQGCTLARRPPVG